MKEPFLINPLRKKISKKRKIKKRKIKISKNLNKRGRFNNMSELLLLNPKKRKRSIKKAGMGKKHRLVGYGSVGNIIISPRSKLAPKSRGRVLNPLVKTNELNTILGISSGFVVSRVVPRFFQNNLPPNLQTGLGKIAVQSATGLAVSFIVSNVLKKKEFGKLMMYGTLLNAAISLIDNYILKGQLSAEGLSVLSDYELPEVKTAMAQTDEPIVVSQENEEVVSSDEYTEEAKLQDLSEDEQPIIIT